MFSQRMKPSSLSSFRSRVQYWLARLLLCALLLFCLVGANCPNGSSTVHLTGSPILLSPATVTLPVQGTQQYQWSQLQGSGTGTIGGVTWSVKEPGGGTIDTQGLYTAPNQPGDYHVQAVPSGDTISPPTSVTVHVVGGDTSITVK